MAKKPVKQPAKKPKAKPKPAKRSKVVNVAPLTAQIAAQLDPGSPTGLRVRNHWNEIFIANEMEFFRVCGFGLSGYWNYLTGFKRHEFSQVIGVHRDIERGSDDVSRLIDRLLVQPA